MPKAPDQFIIVQDKNLVNATKQSVTTPEGGAVGGPSSANSLNMGTMNCFTLGTLKSTAVDLDLRVQDSGSLNSTTWAWKLNSATSTSSSDVYYGEPDRRWAWNSKQVFGGSGTMGAYAYSATGVLNETLGRIIVYRFLTNTTIQAAYKDLDDADYNGDDSSWTTSSITIQGADDLSSIQTSGFSSVKQAAQMDVCAMRDKSFRLAVKNNNDIDVYYSDDGLSWSLFAEKILSRFADRRSNFRGMRIASSGDFIRIIFIETQKINLNIKVSVGLVNNNEVYSTWALEYERPVVVSMTSSDFGATWKETAQSTTYSSTVILDTPNLASLIASASITALINGVIGSGTSALDIAVREARDAEITSLLNNVAYAGTLDAIGEDKYSLDIMGLDNESGSFIITTVRSENNNPAISSIVFSTSAPLACRSFFASGFSVFTPLKKLSFFLSRQKFPRVFLCSGQNWNWLYLDYMPTNYEDPDSLSSNSSGLPFFNVSGSLVAGNVQYATDGENAFYYVPKNENISSTSWASIGAYTAFKGGRRYRAARGKLFSIGDGIGFICNLADTELNIGSGYVPRNAFMRWGGWQTRPIAVNQLVDSSNEIYSESSVVPYQPDGRLFDIEWQTSWGTPNGLYGPQFSQWEEFAPSGSTSMVWNPERIKLDSTTAGADSQLYWRWIDPRSEDDGGPLKGRLYTNSPDGGWIWNSRENPAKGGSCIMWACKVSGGSSFSTTGTAGATVYIESYLPTTPSNTVTGNPNGNTAAQLKWTINLRTDGIQIYDILNSSSIYNVTTGIDLSTHYYEFRLAFKPVITSGTNRTAKAVLCYRKYGTETWTSTSVFSINPSTDTYAKASITGDSLQVVRFGNYTESSAAVSEWRYMCVHQGSDLSTFSLVGEKPDVIRGKLVSGNPTYIKYGVYGVWGGVGGAEGDTFDADVYYSYAVTNATNLPSPRTQFRTNAKPAGTEELVLKAKAGERFNEHEGCALFGCNGSQSVAISYSEDNVSYTATEVIGLEANTATVSSFSQNTLSVTFANVITRFQYNSDDNVVYYASYQGTTFGSINQYERFEIVKHDDDLLVLDMDESAAADFSGMATSQTFKIYADRGYKKYSTPRSGQYMKLAFTGAQYSYENYLKLGAVVAGTVVDFAVPLNWQYQDNQQPNVNTYKTRGGVSWGYREGPPIRTISASMVGDVSQQQRVQIRDLLNMENAFVVNPMVLILNHEARDYSSFYDSRNILLGRWVSGSDLKNDGWWYDTENSIWRPIGDMSVTIEEIV